MLAGVVGFALLAAIIGRARILWLIAGLVALLPPALLLVTIDTLRRLLG